MASVARLLRPARRLCAERGRKDSGSQPVAMLLVVLEVVVAVRHLANAYLAALVGPHLQAAAGARYLVGSAWLLLVYFCTAGCARAVRTSAVLLTHERFRASPVHRRTLAAVLAHAALVRPAALVLVGLYAVSVVAAVSVWGPSAVPAPGLCLLAASGLAAYALTYVALVLWRISDRALGYLEVLCVAVLANLNPDLRVAGGDLTLALSNGAARAPAAVPLACLTLGAVPAGFAVAAAATTAVRALLSRSRRAAPRRELRPLYPLIRLYRADLPLGLFAFALLAEGALALGGSLPAASIAPLATTLLVLRLGWYALFVFRTEYRLADWRPAPAIGPRGRLLVYARTAPAHLAICLSPALFYIVRAARA